jgi:hypothetical protein
MAGEEAPLCATIVKNSTSVAPYPTGKFFLYSLKVNCCNGYAETLTGNVNHPSDAPSNVTAHRHRVLSDGEDTAGYLDEKSTTLKFQNSQISTIFFWATNIYPKVLQHSRIAQNDRADELYRSICSHYYSGTTFALCLAPQSTLAGFGHKSRKSFSSSTTHKRMSLVS